MTLFTQFFFLGLLNFIHLFRLEIFVPRGEKLISAIESEPSRLLLLRGFCSLLIISMRNLWKMHRGHLGGRASLLYFLSHIPSLTHSLSHPHDFINN